MPMYSDPIMREFSIKDLENLTGIKAHTIRIWEQRYNLLSPQRTDTNIRFYNGNDLKLLLNISLLAGMGYRISQIVGMDEDEMRRHIQEKKSADTEEKHLVNILKIAMLNYDEELWNNAIDRFLINHDLEQAFHTLFLPFLHDIGLLWQTNSICPAQEHFISNLIRQKLYASIDRLALPSAHDGRALVLFLPDNELHDIGLIMLHYIFRFAGRKTIYLGTSVPFLDLTQVLQRLGKVSFVSLITTSPSTSDAPKYLERIVKTFDPNLCDFHLSGYSVQGLENPAPDFISIYQTPDCLVKALV